MASSFKLLIIVFVVSSVYSDSPNPLQPQINSLLAQLSTSPNDAILYWNSVALQACANDYDTSVTSAPQQLGPTGTSRAFAIIHGAMFDSFATISETYKPIFNCQSIPNFYNVDESMQQL
jgi:hypothetical protein